MNSASSMNSKDPLVPLGPLCEYIDTVALSNRRSLKAPKYLCDLIRDFLISLDGYTYSIKYDQFFGQITSMIWDILGALYIKGYSRTPSIQWTSKRSDYFTAINLVGLHIKKWVGSISSRVKHTYRSGSQTQLYTYHFHSMRCRILEWLYVCDYYGLPLDLRKLILTDAHPSIDNVYLHFF